MALRVDKALDRSWRWQPGGVALWLLLGLLVFAVPSGAQPTVEGSGGAVRLLPRLRLSKTALAPEELAVIVNDADPLSLRIGEYYRQQRNIPAANLIHVRFRSGTSLPPEAFSRIKRDVDRRLPRSVQGLVLAWTTPYRVDCMSITSAFAMGFDRAYCSATRCGFTKPSGYFDSLSTSPYMDLGIRPAMMLAGTTFESVKSLIDRGVASDGTFPTGTGYLVKTPDQARSVRAVTFDQTVALLGTAFRFEMVQADAIENKQDVLFYFTGLVHVPHLETLRFVPGALADHLTSAGGQLTGGSQMSALRWLEAGATGSYGTVVEPCNLLQKFPFPAIAMAHYAAGASLLESYWKSVAWPGEGVFVGEPLARPYRPELSLVSAGHYRLRIFAPVARMMVLEKSTSPVGPYVPNADSRYSLKPGLNEIEIELPGDESFYRLGYESRPAGRSSAAGQLAKE